MNEDLRTFYDLVKQTREVVFGYCERLPDEVYTHAHPDFGFGSIRNLHVHVADCYLGWVGAVGLGRGDKVLEGEDFPDVGAVRGLFAKVDETVEAALRTWNQPDEVYEWTQPKTGRTRKFTRRWLLLHPVTHEFHHKGQMVALGRALGYPVPDSYDTDLVNPLEP